MVTPEVCQKDLMMPNCQVTLGLGRSVTAQVHRETLTMQVTALWEWEVMVCKGKRGRRIHRRRS